MDTKDDNSTESHDLPFALSPSVTTDMPQLAVIVSDPAARTRATGPASEEHTAATA